LIGGGYLNAEFRKNQLGKGRLVPVLSTANGVEPLPGTPTIGHVFTKPDYPSCVTGKSGANFIGQCQEMSDRSLVILGAKGK